MACERASMIECVLACVKANIREKVMACVSASFDKKSDGVCEKEYER
jgi:hypothetical protein